MTQFKQPKNTAQTVLITLAFILLSACYFPLVSPDYYSEVAKNTGYKEILLEAEGLPFFSLNKFNTEAEVLRVYIEGDGRTWITKYRPSADPTPMHPMALQLALRDPSKYSISYLARPCQFRSKSQSSCSKQLWTKNQYSKHVIRSINTAISNLKALSGTKQIELIGYSGGGTVALLIAAIREDVINIRTIAGNLNPSAFTKHHKVSSHHSSLNPADFTDTLQNVAQLHMVGANDKIVPPYLTNSYVSQFKEQRCIQVIYLEKASHKSGWREKWPSLLGKSVNCKN